MAEETKADSPKHPPTPTPPTPTPPTKPHEIFASLYSLKTWWSACEVKPPKLIPRGLHCLRTWGEWDTMRTFLDDLRIKVEDPSTWDSITSTEMGILCISLVCESEIHRDLDLAMALASSLASRDIVRKRTISLVISHLVTAGRIGDAVDYFISDLLPRFEPKALDLKPFGSMDMPKDQWVKLLEAIHASGHPIDLLTLPLGESWRVEKGDSLGLSLKPMDPQPLVDSLKTHIRDEFGKHGERKLEAAMKVASEIDFDVVVDGANVLFSKGGKMNFFSFARLNSLLVNLRMKGHKPLIVLHQGHMRFKGKPTPGFGSFLSTWKDRVVSTPFGMNDDHFAILICLMRMKTHPSIFLVTKDLLRDHVAHWDSRMRRWHTEHAVTYTIAGHPSLGYQVDFKFPYAFSKDLYITDDGKTFVLPLQMPPHPPSPVRATRWPTVYFGVLNV